MNAEKSPVSQNKLPKKICVLDIETYGINHKHKEETKLAFCGVKLYTFSGSSDRGSRHKVFFPEQVSEFEAFLKSFDGVSIAEYLTGNWGTIVCSRCGSSFHFGDHG
jgi:hypothetical protein